MSLITSALFSSLPIKSKINLQIFFKEKYKFTLKKLEEEHGSSGGREEDSRLLGYSTELKIQFLCQVAFYIFLQNKFLKYYSESLGLAKPMCPIPCMCVCFKVY